MRLNHYVSIGLAASLALMAPAAAVPVRAPTALQPVDGNGAGRQNRALALLAEADAWRMEEDPAYAAQILEAIAVLEPLMTDGQSRQALRSRKIAALRGVGRAEEASRHVAEHLEENAALAEVYPLAIEDAYRTENYRRVVEVLEQADRAVTDPGERNRLVEMLAPDGLYAVDRRLGGSGMAAERGRLATALLSLGWPGPARRGNADAFRFVLINQALERGDRAAAARQLAGLERIESVVITGVMKRFDGVAAEPLQARMARAQDAQDKATRDAVAANPGDVVTLSARADFLRSAQRNEEVVTLLQPMLGDVAATVASHRNGVWIINAAAYALVESGREAEGLALMGRIAALDPVAQPMLANTSINYAGMLEAAGRHADALAQVRKLDSTAQSAMSDYGRMWVWASGVCAETRLGNAAGAAAWSAKMEEKKDSNFGAMLRVSLCLGDDAGAERMLLGQLQGDGAEAAVLLLQNYLPSAHPLPADTQIEVRLRAIRARPAVRAALERVGRIIDVPLPRGPLGSL